MVLKKHSAFSFILIAIVFLFLSNASAAAVLKNSFENSQFASNCMLQNPAEAAEGSALQTSFFETHDSDFSFRHPSPNRLSKKESNYIIFDYQEWLPKFSFASYNPLLRPAYYHFLFRHYLF